MKANRAFRQNDNAASGIAGLGMAGLTIAGVIIGAVVIVSILAALLPNFAGSMRSIVENMTTLDLGDETANSIAPVLGTLVAFAGLFAIVALVIAAVQLRRGGS